MNKIVIKQLVKKFAGQSVLADVSFSAAQGEIIALLGVSGSGKSTLLRCINQLEQPDAGEINVAGCELHFPLQISHKAYQQHIHQVRRNVGMVFQQFNLWSHINILQNLTEAPLHVLKEDKKTVTTRALALLETLGIAEKQNAYPSQLSGGQQQRAAIARALMMQPKVMLFDEPTSALDPETAREIISIIHNLAQQGIIVLIATHEVNVASDVASHVMFLEQGHIIEFGPAQTTLQSPQTDRLREFLAIETIH